jgi:hypothetical protein
MNKEKIKRAAELIPTEELADNLDIFAKNYFTQCREAAAIIWAEITSPNAVFRCVIRRGMATRMKYLARLTVTLSAILKAELKEEERKSVYNEYMKFAEDELLDVAKSFEKGDNETK